MPPSAATTSSMLEDYIKRMNIDGKILASNMDSGVRGGVFPRWVLDVVSGVERSSSRAGPYFEGRTGCL